LINSFGFAAMPARSSSSFNFGKSFSSLAKKFEITHHPLFCLAANYIPAA